MVLPIGLLRPLRLVARLKLPLPAVLPISLLKPLRLVARLTSLPRLLRPVALPTNRKKSLLPAAPLAVLATSNFYFPP